MRIKKNKVPLKTKLIFILLLGIILIILYNYIRYINTFYERLDILFEDNKELFGHLKEISHVEEIERGEVVTCKKENGVWIFDANITNFEEQDLFEDDTYVELLNNLEKKIKLKEISFAHNQIRIILKNEGWKYAEIRYTEEKWFRDRMRGTIRAKFEGNWFIVDEGDDDWLAMYEERMDSQKKAFRENISLLNEYIDLLRELGIFGDGSYNYSSFKHLASYKSLYLNFIAMDDEKLKRFMYLTEELKNILGLDMYYIDNSDLELSADGIVSDNELDSSIIKFSEHSEFEAGYRNMDNIDEVLAPNWYYLISFYYNPLAIER